MTVHPVAALFPMLSDADLADLARDIAANGQHIPCVRSGDVLIDGRNRLAACKLAGVAPKFTEYRGDSPVSFIIATNLTRRHLDKGQKVALAVEIEPHFAKEAKARQKDHGGTAPGRKKTLVGKSPTSVSHHSAKSRTKAAKAVGISDKLLSQAKVIRKSRPDLFEKIVSGKLSVAKAKKLMKADADKAELEAARTQISKSRKLLLQSVCDLRHCSCRELFASGVKPDVVLTDPPYPIEFLPCFTELAEGCASVGVPVVAVMSGQSHLPDVYRRMCEHLQYRWTLAYLTPGGQSVQQWPCKVNTFWKPVLLFGEAVDWIGDVSKSSVNDNDKRFHGWGQSESGMLDLVERLTKPGQLVCDPFLGGGTTAVACVSMGRKFVGCDIDKSHVESALARVEALECLR